MKHFLWLLKHYIPSLIFCLRYLNFKDAIRVPILLGEHIKTENLKRGDIIIKNPRRSQVIIGFEGTVGKGNNKTLISIKNGGKIIFQGSAMLSKGTSIVIDGGTITIGESFFCNSDCWLYSDNDITFGSHCLLGWDININTTDGHYIVENGQKNKISAPIIVKDHVWICSYVTIGKGVTIGNDSVVAQHALVTKSFPESNQLIGGLPAKVIKKGIDWAAK